MALSNRSSAHIKQMAAEFFKKVTHKAIDFAKYLSMTFPFFCKRWYLCNMRYASFEMSHTFFNWMSIWDMYIILMTQIRNLTRFIHNMSIVKLLIIYMYYKRIHRFDHYLNNHGNFLKISMCCSYIYLFIFFLVWLGIPYFRE